MNHSITIYSTSSCHYCQIAKDFLRSKDIPFIEYNVGLDPEKRKEMVDLTGQMGVPVIVVDDTVMVGYSEARLRDLVLSDTTGPSVSTDGENGAGVWNKVKRTLGIE